jgi:hypothetical protein
MKLVSDDSKKGYKRMNAVDEILQIAGNDTCAEVGARIGVPGHTVASILNLSRLTQEEQMVEAAPAVNCWNLAKIPADEQEQYLDRAITMLPRQFEEVTRRAS